MTPDQERIANAIEAKALVFGHEIDAQAAALIRAQHQTIVELVKAMKPFAKNRKQGNGMWASASEERAFIKAYDAAVAAHGLTP